MPFYGLKMAQDDVDCLKNILNLSGPMLTETEFGSYLRHEMGGPPPPVPAR